MKRIQREFYFTKKERKSLMVLSLIIILLLIGLILIYKFDKPKVYTFKELNVEKFEEVKDTLHSNKKGYFNKTSKKQRFKFDPNTVTEDSLKALGINRFAINNLLKYRSKGWKIKDIEHFYKIYGMDNYKGELDEYLIFKEAEVVSAKNENSNINSPTGNNKKEYIQNFENKPISIVSLKSVDINRADSFELQSLKGIGSVIAKRIIKYRDALGGFYDLLQLEEVYGMNSQTFMEINHLIKIDDSIINKIDINKVDDVTLERHPYISKKQASIIVKYRNNHGGFKSLEDFAKVKIFSTSELEKISHYIKY